MPKQYKADCTKHENCELTSYVGEDLEKFRKRMIKQGHQVGELKNADYMLTDRGHLILSELMTLAEKFDKQVKELGKEYKEIKGVAQVGRMTDMKPPENPGRPEEAGSESTDGVTEDSSD
jgi:hypothetical protein